MYIHKKQLPGWKDPRTGSGKCGDPALIERIKSLESFSSIAMDFGVSREWVRRIAKDLGITGQRKWKGGWYLFSQEVDRHLALIGEFYCRWNDHTAPLEEKARYCNYCVNCVRSRARQLYEQKHEK